MCTLYIIYYLEERDGIVHGTSYRQVTIQVDERSAMKPLSAADSIVHASSVDIFTAPTINNM